jgi:hypothetical protein
MGWRHLWRTSASAEQQRTTEAPESVEAADAGPDDPNAAPTRFFFVVARQRIDLFLTMQRQFRGDRTVYVMLDRREHNRRGKSGPIAFPDRRRHADRRRPTDYWEDTAHHPAVLIPLSRLRETGSDSGSLPPAEISAQDREPATAGVRVDEARLLAWVQEGRYVVQHVLPLVFGERDTLKSQLRDASERCKDLQEENDGLRAEVARITTSFRQLEQAHDDIVDSVGQFLTRLTHALEPMRDIVEKVDQARLRRRQ